MTENNNLPIGIHRIDNPLSRTHSWQVVIQRRGKITARHFSDGVYGGKQLAYEAALAFLTAAEQTMQRMLRREYADILRKNNTSGIPGVSKHKSEGREYWHARWPTNIGQSKSVKFSVAKYGNEKAFELALAARKSGLESLSDPYENTRRSKRGSAKIRPLETVSHVVLAPAANLADTELPPACTEMCS